MIRPFGRARRQREARRRALLHGEATTVAAKLRRTSARGWGAWTDATLAFGPSPHGAVRWHVDDPIAVGLPATRGPVTITLAEIDEVWRRAVRFRTEAFFGMDADIVVLDSERGTVELALPADLVDAVEGRLRAQLGLDASF
ncbi:MAG: hypothetical protein KF703_06785 [Actinobacteria bacterium]|nr:hypothetical protein [Actinomycetota bacterium]